MHKTALDRSITRMLRSGDGISDLFLAGKPPLVENHGRLEEMPFEKGDPMVTVALIEALSELVTAANERLAEEFEKTGACDCSYDRMNVGCSMLDYFGERSRAHPSGVGKDSRHLRNAGPP